MIDSFRNADDSPIETGPTKDSERQRRDKPEGEFEQELGCRLYVGRVVSWSVCPLLDLDVFHHPTLLVNGRKGKSNLKSVKALTAFPLPDVR
jgi:hypothetical protein